MKDLHIRQRTMVAHQFSEDVPDILQRIYVGRGVVADDELGLDLGQLLPFTRLLNIDTAVRRCVEALQKQQHILVVGDYDADGATSTALLIRLMRKYGLENIDYLVPNRFHHGYGLSSALVKVATQSSPDLIITVDNGISSVSGVASARQAGIDVLVTDHHLPGDMLPDATVILNPNQPGDSFPSKALAGVGVVFYLMVALRARLKQIGWFDEQGLKAPNLAAYLDIVALGTVSDMVPLDRNNRILVEQGMRRIRAGLGCKGIEALIELSRRDRRHLRTADIGFAIAPRLNAAGRLDDMSVGIECLLSDDAGQAALLANELDIMNRERRVISQEMEAEATGILDTLQLSGRKPLFYCLYQPHWHQGVTGILAGRVKDQSHRPAIVFACGDEEILKGSARSINGFHIRDALEHVATQYPGLVKKFGGHAMAAGLTIEAARLPEFEQAFHQIAATLLDDAILQDIIFTDGALSINELDLETARMLEAAGPWGQQFPVPLFEGEFTVLQRRRIGADKRHLKLKLDYQGQQIEAIAFNLSDKEWPENRHNARLTYQPAVNRFNGFETLQLVIQNVIHTADIS